MSNPRRTRRASAIAQSCHFEPLEDRRLLSTSVPNILPLGDSITEAATGHASYRYWLWNSLADAGYSVDFVGSSAPGVADGPPLVPGFDTNHDGHSEFTADDLQAMVESDEWKNYTIQPQNKPDIVLLHIGTNDVEQGLSDASTRDRIGAIINDLRAINPNVIILLAQIIPNDEAPVSGLNHLLPNLATSKNTSASRVILVNQASGFNVSADTYDGEHPDESGEKKIAAKWFAALTPLLPAPTTPPEGIFLDTPAVPLTSSTNAVGPVEYEMSNGQSDTSDGQMLSLRGQSFMRGFGVHAPSEMDFDLSGGTYTNFRATIGVDDEVDGAGSVVFQVFVNDEATPRYSSPTLGGNDAAVPIDVDITGATSLRLVVTDSGDDNDSDHADWANARLISGPGSKPSSPGNLKAKFKNHRIRLNWVDNADNEDGFRVMRRKGPHGKWKLIAVLNADTESYTDKQTSARGHYYYQIYAFNSDGKSARSNEAGFIVA